MLSLTFTYKIKMTQSSSHVLLLLYFYFQTISNVLLSYGDIISKLFANYVTMEKVVSGNGKTIHSL